MTSRSWSIFRSDGSKMLVHQGRTGFSSWTRPRRARHRRRPSPPRACTSIACPPKSGLQIFNEVWRRYRDFFYVPNMHGYDWEALREQYKPLLAVCRASLRSELCDQRDDLGADRAARLYRRRRLPDFRRGRASRCPARVSSSIKNSDRYRISQDLRRARTKKRSIARR